jgi:multiple sugar transport system ATP-binding protein
MMASVAIRSVGKAFGSIHVIHDVDVEIADGEFVVLVGPSGCGKSTLLRMIAGLEHISAGEIRISGRVVNNLPPKERDTAMVFQNYALYPHMTVAANMGFSMRLRGAAAPEIAERVNRAAEILGLTPYLDRYPRQLSGGQRQRVAMGRAIVRDPKVFLVRRAVVQSRRQAAGTDANGDQGAASAAQDHDHLCHPRPDRGHDHGRQDCGDA